MQIRIYLDGTFESLSTADTKAELATLKADLKIITKVEGLRVKREAAKKAGNTEKDKAFLAEIKKLKATLSSNRNSSIEIVREKIAKLSKAAIAPKLTRGNKTGDPRRNPVRKKAAPAKKAPDTREQRLVDTMRKLLKEGYSFTDSKGKTFKGLTALDLNEQLRYDKEFSKVRTSTTLQMLLRKEGLNVQVHDGKREGRGKMLKVWTV